MNSTFNIFKRLKQKILKLQLVLFYPKESDIFTHLTNEEKLKLLNLAQKNRGYIFVEIGSYIGASSCFIAAGIKKSLKKSQLYCVDTWQNDAMSEVKKDTYPLFIENTSKYKEIIVPLRGTSVDVAKTFNKKVDFLFIDGNHSYEGVKADVDAWFPKLNARALVIFHDIDWAEGVKKVITEDVSPLVVNERRLPNMFWAWVKK